MYLGTDIDLSLKMNKDQQLLSKIQTIVKSHQKLLEFLPFLMILKLQLLH